jgi:hypothetical protein
MKGFKGFDKDLKCQGFQYEIGKEYEHKGTVRCCYSGFHFCENPLDVLSYYGLGKGNRYCEVEGSGEESRAGDGDSKVATSKIRIGPEIGLKGIIQGAVRFVFERAKTTPDAAATTGEGANAATTGEGANAATTGEGANAATTGYRANAATTGNYANAATTGYRANAATTGNYANAATTGYCANAATTGNYANAATTGYCADAATTGEGANAATTGNYADAATTGEGANAATTGYCANAATTGYRANAATTGNYADAATTGQDAIAAALGINSRAKAALGSWIVLAEWEEDANLKWHVSRVCTAKVDGKKIKADTWYRLEDGRFEEVSQ